MGKIIADSGSGKHEDFLRGVQQMYTGTRAWGTVRLTIKRSKSIEAFNLIEYIEKHAFARKYNQERSAERRAQISDSGKQPFGLYVKAQSPRRKISAQVSYINLV